MHLAAFQLVVMTIYPTLIQPLFNNVTPLEPSPLRTAIENLAQQVAFPLTKLYVIDGSRRSAHSNGRGSSLVHLPPEPALSSGCNGFLAS